MQVTVSLVGVFICLVSLTTAAAETTSSSTAQASSASSSTTQAAVMQRVYNETRSVKKDETPAEKRK